MIQVQHVNKSYGPLHVLKDITLSIEDSKVVSIVGPSGAGKSTLLHIMGTLDRADSGTVVIQDTVINKLRDQELSDFRNRHIGFVFQFHHLLPEFTAAENVALPAMIAGLSKKEALARAEELLAFLHLQDRMTHKPAELSGGEQQRVAVARALVNKPEIILADEPSGNLDTDNARKLHQLFFELRDQFHQTFVIVTHNEELAALSDCKIQLQDGRLINP
ncbi:MAG: ABC transporter ATP-binding protein [Bacteroidales bacterium]|nr:ABC transporter ATP-binding protein [Bacteroidales bacterium]